MSERTSILSKLLKDKRAAFGIAVIVMAVLVSILGAYPRPDKTENANDQHLSLARLKPGAKAEFLLVPKPEEIDNYLGKGLFFGGLDSEFNRYPISSVAIIGDKVTLLNEGEVEAEFALSLFGIEGRAPELSEFLTHHAEQQTFWLGTDGFGRDLLSRLLSGTIVSLSVGLISVLISLFIGIGLGAIAGYFGGKIDDLVMWFINVIWSIPTLLMVIAITLVMGKGFVQVFIAVGLTMWVEVARVVRGQVMGMKQRDFVEAGRALGFSDMRLIVRHILPNIMGPVIVISAANFASAILIEAGLSFLGIGTQIPMSSWGMMIKDHYQYITTDLAYLAILPGLCIISLVMAFMLLGNGLRDALDVRST